MSTYTPQSRDVLLPGAKATTEWYSRVGGAVAGCGEAATAVMLGIMRGDTSYYDPNRVTSLIQDAVQAHQTVGMWAASGQTTAGNLQWLAGQNGVQTTVYDGGQAGTLLAQYAGSRPIVVGVSNARAFGGTDSGVNGHYVTVVGRTAQGDYIVSDPNTAESTHGQFVTYSAAQFAAAQPFAVVMPTRDAAEASGTAAQGTTLAATSGGSGSCKHSVSVAWGTVCLDPAIGFAVRTGLLFTALVLVIVALMILGEAGANTASGATGAVQKIPGYKRAAGVAGRLAGAMA